MIDVPDLTALQFTLADSPEFDGALAEQVS